MNLVIYLIIGVVVGGVITWSLMRKGSKRGPLEEKDINKQKIIAFFMTHERVVNNDIETLLGVSDSTVTRYLDELEKEGKIKQIGDTGSGVYYTKI